MSSKPITRNEKPQMLIKSTLHKTKKFLTKSFTYLKPTKPPTNSNTMQDSKLHEDSDDFYTSFSEKCPNPNPNPNPVEVVVKKKNDSGSKTAPRMKDRAKEETKSSPSGADVLAQKMIELEMMDLNDTDQAMDVVEVLHYYSRLTCPTYVEIVDHFFMDMYSEFHVAGRRSLNASMRKLAPETKYCSMRSLAPLKL